MHLTSNHVSNFNIFIHKLRVFCVFLTKPCRAEPIRAMPMQWNRIDVLRRKQKCCFKWFAWEVPIRWCLMDVMNFFYLIQHFRSLWIIINFLFSFVSLHLNRVADGFFLNKHRSALEISHVNLFFFSLWFVVRNST